MLSRPVIATNITNLTDARYFAARGVDYLLFDLSMISLDQILEIKEWVEGPNHILRINASTQKLVEEAILKVSPIYLSTASKEVYNELQIYQAHVEIIHEFDDQLVLDDETFYSVKNSEQLSKLNPKGGVIISGGEELEIGVKNYDDLDAILDHLED